MYLVLGNTALETTALCTGRGEGEFAVLEVIKLPLQLSNVLSCVY